MVFDFFHLLSVICDVSFHSKINFIPLLKHGYLVPSIGTLYKTK